ncbi:chloramphenicol-sensitive protein RarD [Altererythrobacter xiamenensis]|uniref:Chloramphenicol-sensitive protein RarD n=1 Tax=Altererythrobacter xiamenensis TaxID=1316679 RepID=A0A1Y6EBR2_9SPHN|nr:EamA family transporter RarD [Altererythrobacter xiamenensis]SMQ59975.1 chloramphenicol-sensitive protein RarD [Altererythrobacter xiamenensis]
MSAQPDESQPSGLPAAIGAYLIWGFMPLYLILVAAVPPFEFVGWRIIWTLPICLVIVLFRKQMPDLLSAMSDVRSLKVLTASALLVGTNWLVYIWAIQNGHVYAASLGYYINPLVNVLLGTLVLGERLSRRQWLAVALAMCGIAVLAAGAVTTLWISLTLAFSFGTYGLLRKQVAVGSLPGLTIESAILLLPAAGVAWWYAASPAGSSFFVSPSLSLLIVLGGFVTAIPLLMFAVAARRMDYSTLGFTQFLAPTIVFVLGLTVFGEELKPAQAICFALIWCAVAIFAWDLLAQRRARLAAAG